MNGEREIEFTQELYRKLKDFLEKYRVGGVKLDVRQPTYYGKIPDIVVVDEIGVPQLIIETKRKSETKHEYLYNPLGAAPIAQALCYAALARKHHELDRTPLFATANRDEIVIFKGIEKEELEQLVDICSCREKHDSPEDWAKALKPGAYTKLLSECIIERLENPLSDDTIKKLFEYVEKWITRAPITPAQLYRVLVEELRNCIEKLHAEHVEDAVKAKILNDVQYFSELYDLALKQGYKNGILSSGLFTLRFCDERSIREKICGPLAEEIVRRISEAQNSQERFSLLRDIADKKVRELVRWCREAGEKAPPICSKKVEELLSFRNLSKIMTYVLAAKILAYKVLEMHYDIPNLEPLTGVTDPNEAVKTLDKLFKEASSKLEALVHIRDFKPLFEAGLYDKIVFEGAEAIWKLNAVIEIADALKKSLVHLPGIIGYVYEGFIPPSERHQLGQFYTPPAVARLIARWSIRSGDDRVLDGGCGSGTFLIEAYKRLLFLKYNKVYGESYPSCRDYNEHQDILDKLYGVDINAFATQLTALHLMFMEPKCPFSKLNVFPRDFFSLTSKEGLEGSLGSFDAVIGNPPYTRWVEIPNATRELIKRRVGDLMRSYNLVADIRRGREPGIYVYWILHAAKNLLKDGRRLGMIISNMWLQTDYGVDFGRFLLDNFKLKALIDISYRLFDALISTVIVLAEKEPNKEARDNNEVLLIRIPPIDSRLSDKEIERKLDETLKCIENSITPSYEFSKTVLEECSRRHEIRYRFVKQSEIPEGRKWVSLFFKGVEEVVEKLDKHPLLIRAGEWFAVSRGNSVWSVWALNHGRRPDLGAKDFFYFSKSKIEEWEREVRGFGNAVRAYLVPAITASRYVKTFTFTEEDWRVIESAGRDAYVLVLHEERGKLPQQLVKYIEWGETECRTKIKKTRGGGRVCSEAEACVAREEIGRPFFFGWYDLGGYIPTPVMAVRQARYRPQFFLATMPLVTYDAIITLIPRVKVKVHGYIYDPGEYNKVFANIIDNVNPTIELDEVEIKALLAYLNSTFNWLWLEQNARYIAKGPLGLEANIVENMPVLNVKRIDRKTVEELARLFDELESSARKFIGGQPAPGTPEDETDEGGGKLEMFKKLKQMFREIDSKIAEALGIAVDVDALWNYAWEMMERRIKGAGRRVRPGTEVTVDVEGGGRSRRRRRRKSSSNGITMPLTKWFEPESEAR